ncbi:MAG: hypothetical protein U0263_38500 [Polyangiaceae bacterium]
MGKPPSFKNSVRGDEQRVLGAVPSTLRGCGLQPTGTVLLVTITAKPVKARPIRVAVQDGDDPGAVLFRSGGVLIS